MKFIDRWKQEWWLKEAQKLAKEYEAKKFDLMNRCQKEITETEEAWVVTKEKLLQRINLEQQEINYRLESLEGRKRELAHLDMEVKNQMKMLEAKANPSFVWESAFTAGATKTWDLMEKILLGNIEKIKIQIFNDATQKALEGLNGHNKKTH